MAQTAVTWLVEHLTEYGFDLSHHKIEIQQAKEMEEEQIAAAFDCGYSNGEGGYRDNPIYHGCNYYEETFNGK